MLYSNINTVETKYIGRMSLIQTIQNLSTSPRKQEEEYENTSDFLEWFYYHIYREQGFVFYPILYQVKKDSEYDILNNKCKTLININNTKDMDNDILIKSYEDMKEQLIMTIKKYGYDN